MRDYIVSLDRMIATRPFEFPLFLYYVFVLLPFETLFNPTAFKYTMQNSSQCDALRIACPSSSFFHD